MGKKILWHSNSPLAGSGYGNQTFIFTRLLKEAGWDVTISAFYGVQGNKIEYDGITILPRGLEQWGNDIIGAHYDLYKPDVLFALMDSWVLNDKTLEELPLTLWTPIDHEPAPPMVIDKLNKIPFPVAMSQTGEKLMRYHGIDPFYIPHGTDTEFYTPLDREVARRKFKITNKDTFFVAMNAANKGFPSRKRFEAVFKAWSIFTQNFPNSILYIHTLAADTHSGYDLIKMADFYGISDKIHFPQIYEYVLGDFNWQFLRSMYNAADVLLSPSMGEGFGIPVIEAHACGCPTIVSDFTAQRELGSFYKIPIDPVDDLIYTLQNSEQAMPKVSEIITALEKAYFYRNDPDIRAKAREAAMPYDAKYVLNKYMLPVFDLISQMMPHV